MADIRQLIMAISHYNQAAIDNSTPAAEMVRLRLDNDDIPQIIFNDENDANDKGKGTPFPTEVFPDTAQGQFLWNYFTTSQNLAILGVKGIGGVTKTAAGAGWLYTCDANVSLCADDEMPYSTVAAQICPGASVVHDQSLVGVALEEFTLSFTRGTGRGTSSMRSTWIGSGRHTTPSGLTLPAAYSEKLVKAAGATAITILGTNYVSTKNFRSLEFTWKNNIDVNEGYGPGSGQLASGHALIGKLVRGNPVCTCRYTALFVNGSTELTDYLARTEGTLSIIMQGDVIGAGPERHQLEIAGPRVQFANTRLGSENGKVVVQTDVTFLQHAVNGYMQYKVTTDLNNIGTTGT